MSEIIKCNTGTLASDNGTVQGDITKINTSIETLRTLANSLDNMWDGDASEVFKVKLLNYINRLDTVTNESMASIATYEDTAVTEYNDCERSISGMISSVSV